MRFRVGVITSLALTSLVLTLAGCRVGEPIGDEIWVEYKGAHQDVVRACVRAVPKTIDSPSGYPGAAEFTSIDVTEEVVNDHLSRFTVTGSLKLLFGPTTDLRYNWECEASQRFTTVRVVSTFHELLE